MASTDVLIPQPLEAMPAPSLELGQLDQLCSGNLDALLLLDSDGLPPLAKPCAQAAAAAATEEPVVGRRPCASPLPTAPSPERAAKLAAARAKVRASWQYQATGSAAAAAVLAQLRVRRIASGGPRGLAAEAAALIAAHSLDDTAYVYDLGNVVRMWRAWSAALPRVAPFYAIKCNPNPALLRLLAALGTGFDCASKAEVEAVLGLGVAPSRIIFAHPCKRPSDLTYARAAGVELTTFDTESELRKVAAAYPGVQLVLRVRADDPEARVPLGLKYGADPSEAPRLLATAAQLGLAVVGVSFHVGSACKNLSAFSAAIATARAIFDAGEAAGHGMRLLDIGGGFTGHFDDHGNVVFGGIARAINAALAAHFPPEAGVRVIAEPGRYFAETAATLLVPVYGTRDRLLPGGAGVHKDYWLTDGLYGSFNCILYDDQKPTAAVLRSPLLPPPAPEAAAGAGALHASTLWGPTCDSADYIYKDLQLPALRTGDWLRFANAGAYTVAGACNFNGIPMCSPNLFYVYSDCAVDEEALPGIAEAAGEGADA